jgi:hypothetical protein
VRAQFLVRSTATEKNYMCVQRTEYSVQEGPNKIPRRGVFNTFRLPDLTALPKIRPGERAPVAQLLRAEIVQWTAIRKWM